jgi:hypothetical protein
MAIFNSYVSLPEDMGQNPLLLNTNFSLANAGAHPQKMA